MDKERMMAKQRQWLAAQGITAAGQQARTTKGYEIKNYSDGNAEISLYDEIGPWGVSAVRFNDELRSITARSITLRIASPGGDVADGLAILNALRQHPAMINVIVEGWAASAASFIAMAGDTVQMAPNSMLMIHDAMTLCVGNAEEFLETAALLDKHSDNIADIYARRAGGTVADWRNKMRAESWYTSQEAVDAGLADSIYGEEPEETTEEVPPCEPEHRMEPAEDGTPGKLRKPMPAHSDASSVRVTNIAAPVHHTDTVDTEWDGNAAETALKKPVTIDRAKAMYAWYDAEQEEDGELPRAALKFPHHEVDAEGSPGAANLAAVRNALARLTQSDVPASDHEAIRSHLQAHLDDAKPDETEEPTDNVVNPLASWDFQAIREAITAAKEANTRG